MGAVPSHPFFLFVIESLKDYDTNWGLPYITVMSSTGPLFLSVIWKKYMASGSNINGGRLRILMPDEYNKQPWSFFSHHLGNSWHGKDARFIFWLGAHWMQLTVAGFLLAGVVALGMWWVWGRVLLLGQRRGIGGRGWVAMSWRRNVKRDYELVERRF